MGLRDQSALIDMASVLVLLAAPVLAHKRGRLDGRIGRAALILGGLTVIMPRYLGGGDFADYRLVPVALAAGCLAIDVPFSRRLLVLAALPFVLRCAITTAAWERQSRLTGQIVEALPHIPRGAVVAGAYAEDRLSWVQPVTGHVFAYATVRRDALTNSDFALAGVHLLRHRRADPGFADPSQRILLPAGQAPDLAGFAPARQAQYLWYAGDVPPRSWPAGAVLVYRNRQTLLLRLAKSTVSR
jgi:hypothetical protein